MSATPRILVRSDLLKGAPLALTSDQANYLFRVLRLEIGAPVRVFNGRDGEWLARVHEIMRSAGFLTVESQLRPQTAVGDLHLLFAPLKKTRTDFVVEKATELGVSFIQPVITARTQTKVVRTDRLQKLAEEAAEQTERMETPCVEPAEALMTLLDRWPEERTLLFCDERGDDESEDWGGESGRAQPIFEAIKALGQRPAAVLIGPEGGFTPPERERLRKMHSCIPVGLGPRILRAETAAVAALAVWQAVNGDWLENEIFINVMLTSVHVFF